MKNSNLWIRSRVSLLIAIVVDASIFISFYFLYPKIFLIDYPSHDFNAYLYISFWITLSYVLGRYSPLKPNKKAFKVSIHLEYILKSYFISFVLFILSISYFYVFNSNDINEEIGIQIINYLFIYFPFVSYYIQFNCFYNQHIYNPNINTWIYVGSHYESFKFNNLNNLSNKLFNVVEFKSISELKMPYKGFIINKKEEISPDLIKSLYSLNNNNTYYCSILEWCDLVLQRYPQSIISTQEIIETEFLPGFNTIQSRIKRVADILLSILILLITSPILLISSILIKIQDGGPILYSQKRNGFKERTIRIWKLRTMNVDSERNGPQWSSLNDSRITFIGKFLRLSRLDELPQLVNVILGDMSLIGPRPERPEIDNSIRDQIPNYSLRYFIRPGLSGWAQVNYPYGASVEDTKNKLSYDLFYIRNFSILLDIVIFFKTIKIILNSKGAVPTSKSL